MIELIDVTKHYDRKLAVENLTLSVSPGELFAFLGPNGAGKTTTIKMMCGLLFPTSGTIRVGGFDIQKDGDRARQIISYVPDQPFLYEKLTGREFMEFIIEMYGMDRVHGHRRMDEMIGLFGLEKYVDDLVETYSHGMKQRTVFASALLHEPQLLIVDEPMVGLDPEGCHLVKDIFRHLVKQGVTIFMSTHSLDVAQQLASRIGIVHCGRLISCGTMDSLRHEAASDGSLEDVFLILTHSSLLGHSPLSEAAAAALSSSASNSHHAHGRSPPTRPPLAKGGMGGVGQEQPEFTQQTSEH